jgi:surface protein
MAHLDGEPCAECAILQRDEPKEQIRTIIDGTFTPVDIGKGIMNINKLVDLYIANPPEYIKTYGHLCVWNTGAVKDMEYVCENKWKVVNDDWDVRLWDTRCVTSMRSAFVGCLGSLHGVEHWNVAGVTNLSLMFHCSSFNRDIGNWDTSKVENMSNMFNHALSFNQDIGPWDTGNVTDVRSMFEWARSFNQDISKWNTGNVKYRSRVFENTTAMTSEYKPGFSV